MSFYCIGDEETVRGFLLAGVEGQTATDASEITEALNTALARPECALIVITQSAADLIRNRVEMIRREFVGPLIVEIPGPDGTPAGRKRLHEIVQAALGVRI